MARPTIAEILARCEQREGGHVHWTGGVKGSNADSPYWRRTEGSYPVRRVAYEEYHGVKLLPSEQVSTCDNPLCIARGCLRLITRSEAARKGHTRAENHARIQAGYAKRVQKQRILLPEEAQLIRNSRMQGKQLSRLLKCSESLVSAIRKGKKYADVSAQQATITRLTP